MNIISTPATLAPQNAAAFNKETTIPFARGTLKRNITRLKIKTVFKVVVLCSLLLVTFAATDCDILNSGIPLISSSACCTETVGIICKNERVIEMYSMPFLILTSLIEGASGQIPLEIGNLTELTNLDIRDSNLSADSVPDSIAMCVKLVELKLVNCKLQGGFPIGIRELKSLGILNNTNDPEKLSIYWNEFTGELPDWICELDQLATLNVGENFWTGEIPACIGNLSFLWYLNIGDIDNIVGVIPIGICQLVHLQQLSLENTSIEGKIKSLLCSQGSIPGCIGALTKLRYFYVHDTYLGGLIPESIGQLVLLKEFRLAWEDYFDFTTFIGPVSVSPL
jgi:hypothetical protein